MSQSPRFKLRQKEIAKVINKGRLKATWKNKVRAALRDQFLPDPIDFYDYQIGINRIADRLETTVLSGNYVPRSPKRITQEKSKGLCIVVTDIANYYDFINYTRLRNVVAGTIKVRETILDFLIFVLSSILWQPDYTPRFEVGLPQINTDAPRILAHCFLFELDKVLAEFPRVDYARFMDDIDLGVDSILEAKQILKQIDLFCVIKLRDRKNTLG